MTTTVRQFVMCTAKAVHRIEGYSARDGRLHGSLDRVVYACRSHHEKARAELRGLAERATEPGPYSVPGKCGRVIDFTAAPAAIETGEREPQREVAEAAVGRPVHELDYAQRASVPMKPAQAVDTAVPAAALAELARDIEFAGLPQLAARARAIVAYLGYTAESLDQVRADLTMLAAHAPDVTVNARTTGEQLLEVVSEP